MTTKMKKKKVERDMQGCGLVIEGMKNVRDMGLKT